MTNKEREIIDRIRAEKIGKKDKEILEKLEKYGVMKAKNIAIISGYNDVSYIRRRLAKMETGKLVKSEQLGYEKIYYLTAKGKAVIGKNTKTFKINSLIFHYLAIGDIAAYLYAKNELAESQIEADRQLKEKFDKKNWHTPDLVIGSTCYEAELTQKSSKEIRKNIRDNARNYDKQCWFVPEDKQGIKAQVQKFAQENGLTKEKCGVYSLDSVEAFIETYFEQVKSGDLPENRVKDPNPQIVSIKPKTTTEQYEQLKNRRQEEPKQTRDRLDSVDDEFDRLIKEDVEDWFKEEQPRETHKPLQSHDNGLEERKRLLEERRNKYNTERR